MNETSLSPLELPTSWAITTLGAVVEYGKTNKAEPSELEASDWVLELEDIEKDSSRLLQRVTFSERQSKSTKNRFQAGDVLYGKLRPYLNKVLIAGEPGYCTTEILPLKAGPHIDKRYLFYWLKHPVFLKYVEAESHGMNMPRLGTETGKAAPVVLAPRNEQTRIANQLDTLLARVQACNDRFDTIPALLKRFRQTVLDQAASASLTEDWRLNETGISGDWKTVTLQEVISEMRNGLAQKPTEQPPGAKILRIGAVRAGQLDLSDHRYLVVSEKEAKQYELRKNDLLFTRYNGSLEFVGVCAALSKDAPGYVYPDKLIRVRAREDLVLPKFIEIVFGSRPIRQQVEGFVKSSAGQRGISGADLKGTKFRLAPLQEQAEIVRRVEALFALADRIEARCTTARAQAQRLSPLVLAKAFRGELVAQDPQDEPASVLLQRIAAAQPAKAQTLRGRPRTKKNDYQPLPLVAQANWAVLLDGAWAAPVDPEGYASAVLLVAVLKAWGRPMPQRQARLATLMCQQPRLFTAVLPADQGAQWCRLVGTAAEPLPAQVASFQPATNSQWRRALAGMRARGDLVESGSGPQATWALGPGAVQIETAGWPDGRAGWVVAYLQSCGVDAILPVLEPAAREFVNVKAA